MGRFCVQCGSELKQGARFCANCGQAAVVNSPEPAVTGERDGATRGLQAPPASPAWDASAVPPDGALLPPPGSARPPQDVPFPPEPPRFPPEGSRFLPEASRFPSDDRSGPPPGRPPKPPDSFGFPGQAASRPPQSSLPPGGPYPPEGPPFPRDETAAAPGLPFPGDNTAGLQTGPASPSKGLALPSAYPAAASALPAAGPPTATGPGYPAPTPTDTAQFSQNWMKDVGFSPQWEPSPSSAVPGGADQAEGTRERPRRLLLAGLIALVAAVIVVPAVLIAHSLHGITGGGTAAAQPTAKQPAHDGTTAAPSQRTAAAGLAALLAQTATDRSSIVNAVGAVEQCTAALGQAPQVFQDVAASRQRLLQQLANLSGRSALPAPMLQALTGAWQASAAVDTDLGKWAQDEAARGCKPADHADANFQASGAPDSQATNDKTAFVSMWNAIATKYGLPRYRTSQL
jgi:zinc-ribbon domain